MSEQILEFNRCFPQASAGGKGGTRVGPDGIIRNVKILGHVSRNGRRYTHEAIKKAAAMYEGAKVNVDHPGGDPGQPRAYSDRIGVLQNVKVQSDGLFGNLHCNPRHPLFEQLAWDAANAPQNVGLSHNIEARTARGGGQMVVEEITRVVSVDLVADPATTHGLFESEQRPSARVEAIAKEVGLPSYAIPSPDGFLQHCETDEQIRRHLTNLHNMAVREGLLPGRKRKTPVNTLVGRADAPSGTRATKSLNTLLREIEAANSKPIHELTVKERKRLWTR